MASKAAGSLPALLKRLNEATEPNEKGSISFVRTDHSELFDLLAHLVACPQDVTGKDVSAITYRAFLDLRRKGRVAQRPLISLVAKRINELRKKPLKTYTMWTKMRLTQMAFSKSVRFKFEDVSVRTVSRLPKWLQLEPHFISGVGDVKPNTLPFYGYVIVSTKARNLNEGSEKVFAALEKFYAVVNTVWRSTEFWISRRPTAVLMHGPNYFFFEGRRFLGKNQVWFNQDFDEKEWSSFPKKASEFLGRAESFRRVFHRLETHPLGIPLVRSLVLISEGMMSSKLSFRLMRFWSAAEALYAEANEQTPTNKLIDRMVFIESGEHSQIEKLKLKRAYELRNEYVHHGSIENDDSALTQNLRETILKFAYYVLFHGEDFENHSDLMMMVDPTNAPQKVEGRRLAIERRKMIMETGRHKAK